MGGKRKAQNTDALPTPAQAAAGGLKKASACRERQRSLQPQKRQRSLHVPFG